MSNFLIVVDLNPIFSTTPSIIPSTAVEGIIEGVVEKIGFRSTTIRKFDKSLAIIPNFQFAENAVVNVSETSNWLISWIITLQYDTTVDQLKKIRDEIESHINSSEDYNTSIGVAVRVDKFSDSSIDMYVRCFTKTGSWNNWPIIPTSCFCKASYIHIYGTIRKFIDSNRNTN